MTRREEGLQMYGTVKVGERGQIVIPAVARRDFDIKTGDLILVMTGRNRRGLFLVKADAMKEFARRFFEGLEEAKE